MTCLRCLRQREREKNETEPTGSEVLPPHDELTAGTEPSNDEDKEETKKQQQQPSYEKVEMIVFQPGKMGLAFEQNAVKKTPKAESQAGKAGVLEGWILHAVGMV